MLHYVITVRCTVGSQSYINRYVNSGLFLAVTFTRRVKMLVARKVDFVSGDLFASFVCVSRGGKSVCCGMCALLYVSSKVHVHRIVLTCTDCPFIPRSERLFLFSRKRLNRQYSPVTDSAIFSSQHSNSMYTQFQLFFISPTSAVVR